MTLHISIFLCPLAVLKIFAYFLSLEILFVFSKILFLKKKKSHYVMEAVWKNSGLHSVLKFSAIFFMCVCM